MKKGEKMNKKYLPTATLLALVITSMASANPTTYGFKQVVKPSFPTNTGIDKFDLCKLTGRLCMPIPKQQFKVKIPKSLIGITTKANK